jgi:hypothetical protein
MHDEVLWHMSCPREVGPTEFVTHSVAGLPLQYAVRSLQLPKDVSNATLPLLYEGHL